MRFLQVMFQVRHEAGNANQIDRTVAEYLVRDMNLTALGVTGFGAHDSPHLIARTAL
jgi:hypothetical protein